MICGLRVVASFFSPSASGVKFYLYVPLNAERAAGVNGEIFW